MLRLSKVHVIWPDVCAALKPPATSNMSSKSLLEMPPSVPVEAVLTATESTTTLTTSVTSTSAIVNVPLSVRFAASVSVTAPDALSPTATTPIVGKSFVPVIVIVTV